MQRGRTENRAGMMEENVRRMDGWGEHEGMSTEEGARSEELGRTAHVRREDERLTAQASGPDL